MSRRATDIESPGVLTLPSGLFGPDQVDVAYEPWLVRAATSLHVGPTSSSPVVITDSGETASLGVGRHFGRQTVRNAGCRDVPRLRAAVDGFVWGYGMPPASRKSGWARLVDLEADPTYQGLACGPAGADFDRRFPQACGGHCDGRPLTGVGPASGSARVRAVDLYLRYAPGSTAYRYLVAGDRVRLLAEWRAGRWVGVEVRHAAWVARRVRGWVLASGLRRD
jgi:hypothetical protein